MVGDKSPYRSMTMFLANKKRKVVKSDDCVTQSRTRGKRGKERLLFAEYVPRTEAGGDEGDNDAEERDVR